MAAELKDVIHINANAKKTAVPEVYLERMRYECKSYNTYNFLAPYPSLMGSRRQQASQLIDILATPFLAKYYGRDVTLTTSTSRYIAWLPQSVSRRKVALLAFASYCQGHIKINNATPCALSLPQTSTTTSYWQHCC